jgi:hypothetical protein
MSMRSLFLRAAAAASLCCFTASAIAAPLAQPCVSGPEAEALVVTAVPALMTTLRLLCQPSLPADALILQPNSDFLGRYQAASDGAWPLAKSGLAKIGGPDVKPLLESDFARPAIVAMIGPMFAASFEKRDCAPTNRLVTMLAPLPPRNAAAALVAFVQMANERKKDPAKKDLLPICGYGQ